MSVASTSAGQGSAAASRFASDALTEYAVAVLRHLGVPAADAREVAGNLVLAELRGVDSHGLIRLPVYARRLKAGVLKARPEVTIRTPFPAVALVDGDNGLGAVVGGDDVVSDPLEGLRAPALDSFALGLVRMKLGCRDGFHDLRPVNRYIPLNALEVSS